MGFLNGITILLIFQLVGEIITLYLRWPVPGPVVGMVLLFAALLMLRQLADTISAASSALLTHLSLLFVPAGVGIVVHFDRVYDEWLAIAVTLLASTVITMAATVTIITGVSRLVADRGDERD